jgi:hypothetical protein
MKIVELHEWIGSKKDGDSTVEMSYMILWNKWERGITIVKKTDDGKGDQRYDFASNDEVERLIEVLSANWEHPCFANKNDSSRTINSRSRHRC